MTPVSSSVGRRGAPPALALLVAVLAGVTVATVWALEHAGYVPCELCLAERNPFYIAVPLALVTAWLARTGARPWAGAGFALLALVFLASAGLAAYHAGVEWQVWAGPTGCSGPMAQPSSVADFMKQLQAVKVVRCDAPALVVFGLSLAGWNVIVSVLLFVLTVQGARLSFRPAP